MIHPMFGADLFGHMLRRDYSTLLMGGPASSLMNGHTPRTSGADRFGVDEPSFADLLTQHVRSRGAASTSPHRAAVDVPLVAADDVEAMYRQAQLRRLADGFGPGDAMVDALAARDFSRERRARDAGAASFF